MQTTFLWNKLHIHRQKVAQILFIGLFLLAAIPGFSQNPGRSRENLIQYDNRLFSYGFTLGVHSSALRLKFSDTFIGKNDTTANIVGRNGVGFSIGFLTNLHLAQYLDVRIMPKVGFYQYSLDQQFTNPDYEDENFFADFTTIDLPLMLKYKSQRRGNFRMFYVGGVTPTVDVTGKKKREENEEQGLRLKGDNLSLEMGFGTDIYFPLFKFSPEIRYSYGIMNFLSPNQQDIGQYFQRVGTQSISLYLVFN